MKFVLDFINKNLKKNCGVFVIDLFFIYFKLKIKENYSFFSFLELKIK